MAAAICAPTAVHSAEPPAASTSASSAAPAVVPKALPPALPVSPPQAVPPAASPSVQEVARDGPDALAAVRRLLADGVPALALLRVERSQVQGVRWTEWETLRLGVLADLGLWAQVAARAESLPASSPLPGPFLRAAWLAGADAALRLPATDAPARARGLAARVIWSTAPTPDEMRRAQVVVIESLFAGGDAPAGYRSILRFRQDTPSPAPATSARFVALIAAHGTATDAVPLLPLLPETHLVRIAVQAQLGLQPPPVAAVQARAALQAGAGTNGGSGRAVAGAADAGPIHALQALRTAARAIGDPLLAVEASERLLDADPSADGAVAMARGLWRDYVAAAPAVANREQLLVGDAFGWSDAAARLAARDPAAARTLFAFLSLEAADPAVRATARLQFASLLREAGLGRAAVRLFLDRDSVGSAPLAPDLRRLLGETAAARRLWAPAADLHAGVDPRPGEDAQAWRMTTAELQARAGRFDDAVAGALASVSKRPDLQARVHGLADLLADAGESPAAARIREAAGPAPAPAAGTGRIPAKRP